jgi:ABC-type transport system substrate-binding protein
VGDEIAQVIESDLQDVGIEAQGSELSAGLASPANPNSPLIQGSFDLEVTNNSLPFDPQSYLYNHFASDQVPNPQLQTGNNRIQDPRLDQALNAAGNSLDDAQRKAAYLSFSQIIQEDEAVIPLFPDLQIDARKSYVEGWGATNTNDFVTWNIQDWWLNR